MITVKATEKCIQGVRESCRIFGNDIVHALDREDFYQEVKIAKGASLKETDVMKEVLDSEVLIAAPVAKSHGSTGVSLSLKGMMGLVLNRSVMHWRYNLHESIVTCAPSRRDGPHRRTGFSPPTARADR